MNLLRWQANAAQWKKDRYEAACVIQKFGRYIIARNEVDMLRMEQNLSSVKAILNAQRNQEEEKEEEIDPYAPVLDENGLPIIKNPTERLIALKEERYEVLHDTSTEEFFDSKVLVFQQRFRMRANKKYLIKYIDSEIKMETKKIWSEEVAALKAEHAKINAMKKADEERRKEMNLLFETEDNKIADETHTDDDPYPTAGSQLWFETASAKDMVETLIEWDRLCKDGWMSKKTMLCWVAKGLMDQSTLEGQVHAWEAIRNHFEKDDLFAINKLYQKSLSEKKESKKKRV